MKIGRILRNRRQRVGDLIVEVNIFVGDVGQGDLALALERHLPVGIESRARVDANRQGAYLSVLVPAASEEITHRAFHRRGFRSVPVDAQDAVPPLPGDRHPDVLYDARTLDLSQCPRFTSSDADGW